MFGHRFFGARYFGPRYWGPGVAAPVETLRGRRRRKKLYVVKFDDAAIGVDSAEEMVALARLSDSIPKVTLSKKVDYGPLLDDLKASIKLLDAERARIKDEDEFEMFIMLH